MVEKIQEWRPLFDEQGGEVPLRAGVSSFGFGGANAHVIIEEYVSENKRLETSSPRLCRAEDNGS